MAFRVKDLPELSGLQTVFEIAEKHERELHSFRKDVFAPAFDHFTAGQYDEKELKCVKLIVDVLKILHEAERKAWLFGRDEGGSDDDGVTTVVWGEEND